VRPAVDNTSGQGGHPPVSPDAANFTNQEKSLERMKSLYKEGLSRCSTRRHAGRYDIARANFEAARSNVELTTRSTGVTVNVSSAT